MVELPWCDFTVKHKENEGRRDARKCRQRKRHLEREHPDQDRTAPEAAVQKYSQIRQKKEAHRLQAIRSGRELHIGYFIENYEGPHKLEHIKGYTIKCSICNWSGIKRFLPEQCLELARGGLRLPRNAFGPKRTSADGLCLWRSLAHYSDENLTDIRRTVCKAYRQHEGNASSTGRLLHSGYGRRDNRRGRRTYEALNEDGSGRARLKSTSTRSSSSAASMSTLRRSTTTSASSTSAPDRECRCGDLSTKTDATTSR